MKCNWCGSSGECIEGCECMKCIDPLGYKNWKFNPDGTFTEPYKNWIKKERRKYDNINNQIVDYKRSYDLFYDFVVDTTFSTCSGCEETGLVVRCQIGEEFQESYCVACLKDQPFLIEQNKTMGVCVYCKLTTLVGFLTFSLRNGGQGIYLCHDCLIQVQRRKKEIVGNAEEGKPLLRIPNRSNVGDFFWS